MTTVDRFEEGEQELTRADELGAMTMGRPYVLISMDPVEAESKIVVHMECGGGVTNRAELEEFLEAALRYLREG